MRFRSRRASKDSGADDNEPFDGDEELAPVVPSPQGPWDASDVDDPAEGRVDLGGLLVRVRDGVELRLQIDEASGGVAAIMLVAEDGAVELRAFASATDANLWDEAREQIAGQFRQQGATVSEHPGEHGTELRLETPVEVEGKKMLQASRMVGIRGPRWLLRAVYYGRYATDPAPDSELVAALRDTVVVRGSGPLPPGEGIPLRLPPDVQLDQVAGDQE